MPKDSRIIWGGRLEAMNGELWAPGKLSFTKPYCGKRGSATMDPIIPSYLWDSNKETEQSIKPPKNKWTTVILGDQEWKHKEYWETKGSEGWGRLLQRGNSKWTIHSQSKPPSPKYSGTYRGKTKKGLDKRGNKRSDMVLYVRGVAIRKPDSCSNPLLKKNQTIQMLSPSM